MSGGRRLLDNVRDVIRMKHYSIRTEQAYLQWIRRYILFQGKRHPRELDADHLSAFLTDLAVRGRVAAATQNQALNAVLFLYRQVLKQSLPWIEGFQRAKQPRHLPVVLTRHEVRHVLAQLEGTVWLMASLTYGGGLRLLECLRMRVKDFDFERRELTVRDGN
jgi:integrase